MRRLGTAVLIVAAVLAAASGSAATLTVTPSPAVTTVGSEVTFTFSPPVLGPDDSLTFDFGDGATGTVAWSTACSLFGGCATITHTYVGAGVFTVTAEGSIGGDGVTGTTSVTIQAIQSSDKLYLLAAAHAPGNNDTVWRSDMELQNIGHTGLTVTLEMLSRNADNSAPQSATVTLGIGASLRLDDVLATEFGVSSGSAALRLIPSAPTLIATSRTYFASPNGTYGQFIPAMHEDEAITDGELGRLLQLSHEPSLASGFRTNLGLLSASPVPLPVHVAFYLADGRLLGTTDVTLKPYEFRQLDKAFELVTSDPVPDGTITVSTPLSGGRFFAYASVVDNLTGDPTTIPAIVTQ